MNHKLLKIILKKGREKYWSLNRNMKLYLIVNKIVNHNRAFDYVKKRIADKKTLDENTVKDFHALLMDNILIGGIYRNVEIIMNYQLMAAGFFPVSIAKENCVEYFEALEAYAMNGDLQPFVEMIAELEEVRLDEYLKATQHM